MDKTAKTVNLALQGGGSHGAFSWGVVDRLLEDERIAVEGISATSAGAMNAAVMAYGMTIGGRAGAKRVLAEFWRARQRHHGLEPAAALAARQADELAFAGENSPALRVLRHA